MMITGGRFYSPNGHFKRLRVLTKHTLNSDSILPIIKSLSGQATVSTNMPSILERYNSLTRYPGGQFLFGKLVGWGAPFFAKIHPRFIELKPAYCETQIKDRRGIRNHLGTINAGALCSMAELTGGLALDSVVPNSMRWIPRAMTVHYHNKAIGTITAVSEFDASIVKEGDVIIPIVVRNTAQEVVFTADITFYLSNKKTKPIDKAGVAK